MGCILRLWANSCQRCISVQVSTICRNWRKDAFFILTEDCTQFMKYSRTDFTAISYTIRKRTIWWNFLRAFFETEESIDSRRPHITNGFNGRGTESNKTGEWISWVPAKRTTERYIMHQNSFQCALIHTISYKSKGKWLLLDFCQLFS